MAKKKASNVIVEYFTLGALIAIGVIIVNMIPDNSPFAPSKKIFLFIFDLLKPDVLLYVIGLALAIVGGYGYMKKNGISFRFPS